MCLMRDPYHGLPESMTSVCSFIHLLCFSQYIFTFNKTFTEPFLSAQHGGSRDESAQTLKQNDLDSGEKAT